MDVFIMHIGSKGSIDIEYTITKQRETSEIINNIPQDSPELNFFNSNEFKSAFPNGKFNCWGVPSGAEDKFYQTKVGDLVLFVPHIGIHDGGIHYIGIIKAKCPVRSYEASKVFWPNTPNNKLYPFIFFFDTEEGFRDWFSFLKDIDYKTVFNPRGRFLSIRRAKFNKFNGPNGYLEHLRQNYGFRSLGPNYPKPGESGIKPFEEPEEFYYDNSTDCAFQLIKARRGQQEFRQALRERYGDNCMISNCDVLEIIEAAHINPFSDVENYDPQNGILLRTDIHTLFDLDLLAIHPETHKVILHSALKNTEYEELEDITLKINSDKKPSTEALRYKWEQFNEKKQ